MGILSFLRPARIIRRKAVWSGLMGTSRMWKTVGIFLIGRDLIRKLSRSGAEVIDVSQFGAGRNMEIVTSEPLSRKAIKRLRKSGELVPIEKQRSDAVLWARSKERPTTTRRRIGRRRAAS